MKVKKKQLKMQRFLLLGLLAIGITISCTDLEVETPDSISSAGFEGVADPSAFVDGMFNDLRGIIGDQANTFALAEVTTDAALIPTRGGDWGDNGIWRQLHQHNWTSDHQFIATVFNQWNGIQFRATQVLDPLTNADTETLASASFLRALGFFVILDNFGQIPFRADPTESLLTPPSVLRADEAVPFIISDLESAIAGLPTITPGEGTIRPGKAAARYLLAKVLLNKHIYLGTSPDTADMTRIISLIDQIEADQFALQAGYFDIFRDSTDSETIWYIDTSVGNRIFNGLHYNQGVEISGGGWNGFSTLAEYYDLFEGDPNINVPGSGQEERRGFVPLSGTTFTGAPGTTDEDGIEAGSNIGPGFLIGQQYDLDGSPLSDRPGNPLVFERNFVDGTGTSNLISNSETTGIRVQKYQARYGGFTAHEIFFRFSDAHLMRAEARMRSGGDPTTEINELRILRQASPIGAVTEQDILDERGRELYAELWRRNDLIRFGQYTRDWELKDPAAVGDSNRNLFPIPTVQIVANPNLTQNPGY